ncbi:MAG: Fis family transcriptional regulator [Gammaproteobacteria bacterium]|nr:Fis family transcriptional regulator [Gammaproteobacteria bacterium]MCY4219329.1 Fis family transcriptional regulator [Gammaproteobacteria bacterium]MCY4275408.1 Fis family transcriptional regulator [Gammaproteobacteria bacterium]
MIKQQVKNALDEYMEQSDESMLCNLYSIVLGEVEKVLLESVMERVNNNQTQAARILGINRNTLRRKLEKHELL